MSGADPSKPEAQRRRPEHRRGAAYNDAFGHFPGESTMSQPAAARVEAFERDPVVTVNGLIQRARAAMDVFKRSDQARVDEAVTAIAWSRIWLRSRITLPRAIAASL